MASTSGSTANAWATIVSLTLPWLGLAGVATDRSDVGRGRGGAHRSVSHRAGRPWGGECWAGSPRSSRSSSAPLVVGALVGQTPDSAAADAALQIKDVPVAYALMLLLIAFGAPFVEELAFRGLFWGAIVKRWGRPWVATIVTGVVFGLFHLEPIRLLGLVGGGIVLGFVRHQKGLAASMVSHACLNSVAALALLLS